MGRELAEPDWLPLTDDELRAILGRSAPGGLGRQPVVTWRSPRPMSAAALVRHGDATVFVKRHHVSVRTPEQLTVEHDLATHLRAGRAAGPCGGTAGRRAVRAGPRELLLRGAPGRRRPRPVPQRISWSPYASLGHAYAAGAALARLHVAAADFGRPARPAAVLMNSFLLDGYQTVRPLTGAEAVALPLLLPVVHVEYALSEADYFTSVAISPVNADLAYEYLIGHARWFGQPPGAALLRFLAAHLGG